MSIPPLSELLPGATRENFVRQGVREANEWQRRNSSGRTTDSFQNFAARVGIGTNNLSSASTYGFDPITRVRTLLEWMYRGSWIVGKAVDAVAEDMTKAGVSWLGSQSPEDQDKLNAGIRRSLLWKRLQQGHKWGRLYGGAIVVMMIDGQRTDTPLEVDRIQKGQFRGFVVLDRWMINPTFVDLVDDPASPDQGFPRYYDVVTYAPPALIGKRVHHTRCFRMIGVELPYWQMVWENYWGMSVLERLYDRLVAFDSSTQGAAQLMYRAYLRTLKIKDLRKIVAAGGPAYEGLVKQIETMRLFQTNEGITTIDAEDTMETASYGFAGVADTILQFGQQLAGAIDTPLVRLFGQAPQGLNATGESDMRIYYDGILQRQENDMRPQLEVALRMIAISEGVKLGDDFGFRFNPLWQLTDAQKSEIAQRNTQTILSVQESGVLPDQAILRELKQQSETTGIWTNITDEDIEVASDELPPQPELGDPREQNEEPTPGRIPKPRASGGGSGGEIEREDTRDATSGPDPVTGINRAPPQNTDETIGSPAQGSPGVLEVAGLPVVIETRRGERRQGHGWSVIMPADYGYIRGTKGADGDAVDCFLGPDLGCEECWVLDTSNPMTGRFDEHKVMLGFPDATEALLHFRAAYSDAGRGRLMGHTRMGIDQLKQWLASGDMRFAVSAPRESVA